MPNIFLFKSVKPKKMREDAFRLEFLSAIHTAERELKKDFEETTKTWNHEVEFVSLISLKGGPSLIVGTDDDVYRMVNNGTPEHDIAPSDPKGFLYFQVGYKPKTKPGQIASFPGGKHGKYTRRKTVHHPGTKARHFDKAIAKKWKLVFKRRMEEAMRIAAEKSGHRI